MARYLLYILIVGTTGSTFFRPWIGVLAYYTLAIWCPQGIWGWVFRDIRVTLIVSVVTIIGFLRDSLSGKLNFSILKERQNIYIVILWLALTASYFFNPHEHNNIPWIVVNSWYLMSLFHKILLFYFISVVLIDNRKKFHCLIMVFLVTVSYYTFWANHQYLTGQMHVPRLSGPGGLYADENIFAMLFVMGVPFLYFMGNYYKNKAIKYLLWGVIPFAWHAVFLTGSRGGLVGLGVVTIFMAIKTNKRILGIGVLTALVVAFIWQGGTYMKEASHTIVDYEEDGSAMGRLDAWEAGIKMMIANPITGVGQGNFGVVFRDYSDKHRRVAHNTVIQLAAQSGIVAGVMFLLIFLNVFLQYCKKEGSKHIENMDPLLRASKDAIVGGLLGFFSCSLFLDLATYETFYYLLILNFVRNRLVRLDEEPT